jgi:hypothetical protein
LELRELGILSHHTAHTSESLAAVSRKTQPLDLGFRPASPWAEVSDRDR